MPIKITVTGDTPLEALASLAAFGVHCMSNADVANAANRIYEAEMHKEAKEKAKATAAENPTTLSDLTPGPVSKMDTAPAPEPETAKQSPVTDLPPEPYVEEPPFEAGPDINRVTGDPPPAPAPEPEPVKPPKLEEVRAAGIEAARKYGQGAIKALLEKYGVPNMTSLAESDRAAFMEALKGLGDGNA